MLKRYFISGATGYIGSMLIKYIKEVDDASQIVALVRDRNKAKAMLPRNVQIIEADLCGRQCVEQLLQAGNEESYVIHCASVTKSAEMAAHPVEVIESIVNTTQNMLEFAKRARIKSMVYLSSMEVYGKIGCPDGYRITEEEAGRGEIDLLNARSCYPLGKRMAENLCYSYYKEYGVPVKIARLAQTFGREIMETDSRVYAQFVRAVRNKEDIVLHTSGESMGNYCDMDDAVRGIMTILDRGRDGKAYNVVNEENTMTIRQMAELVADKVAGGKIKVAYEISDHNEYAPDTGLRLSGRKLEVLGWKPKKTLYDMYHDILCG